MDLDEFLKLNYRVVLTPIRDEDGGGWLAEIPDLKGCMSDGSTWDEALKNLKDAQTTWFLIARKRGLSVPSPSTTEEEYSGKFTMRLPRSLHRDLARQAEHEGISLNQYLLSLISYGFGRKQNSLSFESRIKLTTPSIPSDWLESVDSDLLRPFRTALRSWGKTSDGQTG